MKHISFARPRERVEFDGERCTPWVETQTLAAHVHRYLSTVDLCKGKRVLDIACGEGYGSAMLVRNGAASVTGVDIDKDVIARAGRIYAHEGLDFLQADIRAPLPFIDNSFDVIVSFETIEHIGEHQFFIDELMRVLTPEGVLVISTPDAAKSDPDLPNPFHEKELSETEFLGLINASFKHVSTFYQGYHLGSVMTASDLAQDVPQNWKRDGFSDYSEDGGAALRHYVIAVASNVSQKCIPTGLLHDGAIIASLKKRIRVLEAELAQERSRKEALT